MKELVAFVFLLVLLALNSNAQEKIKKYNEYTELEIETEQCLDLYFQNHGADIEVLKSIFVLYFSSQKIINPVDPIENQYMEILQYLSHPFKEVPVFEQYQEVILIKEKLGLTNTEIALKYQLTCLLNIFRENKSVIDTGSVYFIFGSMIETYREIPNISPGLVANALLSGINQVDLQKELYQKAIVLMFCFKASFPLEDYYDDSLDVSNTIIPISQSVPLTDDENPPIWDEDRQVYNFVNQMPEFPGGWEGFYQYLAANIEYPKKARRKGIEGKVYVAFIIDRDGSISDVWMFKGIGSGCDEEAVRVIKEMPDWTPGMVQGEPVRVQYNLPIKFTMKPLQGN